MGEREREREREIDTRTHPLSVDSFKCVHVEQFHVLENHVVYTEVGGKHTTHFQFTSAKFTMQHNCIRHTQYYIIISQWYIIVSLLYIIQYNMN